MDAVFSLLANAQKTLAESEALQTALGVQTTAAAAARSFIVQTPKDTAMPYLVLATRSGANVDAVVRNDELLVDIWDYLADTDLSRLHNIREAVIKLFHYHTLVDESESKVFFLTFASGRFLEVDSSDGLVRRFEMSFAVRVRSHV